MHASAKTVAMEGIIARQIDVQCQFSRGPHNFQIVGLPGQAVREAKERIMAAFYNHSLSIPPMRITVNLSPAHIPKSGSHYDLPIAIALLVNMELLPEEEMERCIAMGELSLNGSIDRVDGVLAAAVEAQEHDFSLICPPANASEAMLLGDLTVLAPKRLLDLIKHYRGRPMPTPKPDAYQASSENSYLDLREIRGLTKEKRALEVAAAGRHHFLMIGPPGAGKSMLSSALPGIMPKMSAMEILETTLVHSVAGTLDQHNSILERPYYAPHHTASAAAIVGGGKDAGPGEISLSHNGVLFLDELPEFKRDVLESLRQPLETGEILVSRANAHVHYPAKFLLVAAANPCPCGYIANPQEACARAPECSIRYLERISGPLMDRFTLRLEVDSLSADELLEKSEASSSEEIRRKVNEARWRQYNRNGSSISNEDLTPKVLDDALDNAPKLVKARARKEVLKNNLSPRGFYRLIKTAMTISDLRSGDGLNEEDIAEAATLRSLDWNHNLPNQQRASR